MTHQQMIMNCIKLFVTPSKLTISKKWTPSLSYDGLNTTEQGLATSGESTRNKRAIPTLVIIQGVAAIGGMMIKEINALVDTKRASSFNKN